MSMELEYARAILDELMGRDRDLLVKVKRNFWDDQVCKHRLVDYCPNELFLNTRTDLGPCPRLHDDKLLTEYRKLTEREQQKFQYRSDFFWRIRGLLRDLDWKLSESKRRMESHADEEEEKQMQLRRDERAEKMVMIEVEIKELLEMCEQRAEEGLVDEAQELNGKVSVLSAQLEALKVEDARERRMEICEVCGLLLIVNDTPERVQAHLTGRQHTGFQRLRASYERMRSEFEGKDGRPLNQHQNNSSRKPSFQSSSASHHSSSSASRYPAERDRRPSDRRREGYDDRRHDRRDGDHHRSHQSRDGREDYNRSRNRRSRSPPRDRDRRYR